jgi:Tfp pilus assembly protein PilF
MSVAPWGVTGMRTTSSALLFIAVLCLLSEPCVAQEGLGATGAGGNSSYGLNSLGPEVRKKRRWDIVGAVVTMLGDPVPDAKVRVEPLPTGKALTVKTDVTGRFQASFEIYADLTTELSFRVTAERKGFTTARELIHRGTYDAGALRITLRSATPNENLLSQEDLVSILGPRLRSLGPSDGLSDKGEKNYKRGVEAFLGSRDPAQALEDLNKVTKLDSRCSNCWAMLALAELDSGDWDGAKRDAGVAADLAVRDHKTGSDAATLLYGVIQGWSDNFSEAEDYLAHAAASSPTDALAPQELGRAQVQIHKWADADASLSKAIAAGAGPEARLLRVQALLGEFKTDEASAELSRYLGGRSMKGQPLRVHMIAERIDYQKRLQSAYSKEKDSGVDPLSSYDAGSDPELQGLVPATSQDPLKPILDAAGKNVARFFQDFRNTSSLEEIHEEQGSRDGTSKRSLDQKCEYICLTTGDRQTVHFKEYRANEKGGEFIPKGLREGFMLTSGFASALYVFHPAFQSQSDFRYLGRQRVEGRETDVVVFAQQPMRTQSPGTFRAGQDVAATYVKGLAWIDSESDQIIRLRTDLLAPIPEIGLSTTTTQIDYQQVRFKASSETFWLPQEVAVTVDWKGKTFHNEHRYGDFRLFNVSTQDKTGKPKDAEQTTKTESNGKTPL